MKFGISSPNGALAELSVRVMQESGVNSIPHSMPVLVYDGIFTSV